MRLYNYPKSSSADSTKWWYFWILLEPERFSIHLWQIQVAGRGYRELEPSEDPTRRLLEMRILFSRTVHETSGSVKMEGDFPSPLPSSFADGPLTLIDTRDGTMCVIVIGSPYSFQVRVADLDDADCRSFIHLRQPPATGEAYWSEDRRSRFFTSLPATTGFQEL